MEDLVTIFVYCFWIAAFCAVVYTAIDTPLRPVQNWSASWRDSFGYAFRHYGLALIVALALFISPLLDFLLGRFGRLDPSAFVEVKLVWHLIASGILAFIAVRVHYWAALDVFDRDHAPPYAPNRQIELWAGVIGIGVVFVIFVISLALTLLLSICPEW